VAELFSQTAALTEPRHDLRILHRSYLDARLFYHRYPSIFCSPGRNDSTQQQPLKIDSQQASTLSFHAKVRAHELSRIRLDGPPK
jgi:hypothetical protein